MKQPDGAPSGAPAGVLLVDDHPAVRQGLSFLLAASGMAATGEAGNLEDALEAVASGSFTMAIVDLTLNDAGAFTLLSECQARGLPSLVYSMHESPDIIDRALRAGAGGYVTKREEPDILLGGVAAVLDGGRYLSPKAGQALAERGGSPGETASIEDLSEREAQVLSLMGRGETNVEIALRLSISARTVETYYARIMEKLGLSSVRELRKFAIAERLGE